MLSKYCVMAFALCLAVQATAQAATPASVDWRVSGAVTPVKKQGQCDSGWAFAAIGAIESHVRITAGKLYSLSEQQLLDCSRLENNYGCNGGSVIDAFKYVIPRGVAAEASYPYTARDGICKVAFTTPVGRIKGQVEVQKSVEALREAVAKQPVAVMVDATEWETYSGGIFSECGMNLNHYVLIVGYTKDYWIVKNSWGAGWGIGGYMYLKMGNTCGVTEVASYPTG